MNKFVLGAVVACLFTTADGRSLVESTSKVALKVGDSILKNRLGIDMNQILAESNEGISNEDNASSVSEST